MTAQVGACSTTPAAPGLGCPAQPTRARQALDARAQREIGRTLLASALVDFEVARAVVGVCSESDFHTLASRALFGAIRRAVDEGRDPGECMTSIYFDEAVRAAGVTPGELADLIHLHAAPAVARAFIREHAR